AEDDVSPAAVAHRNRQRVLMLASRGITARYRHFMKDLFALMPHAKQETKLDIVGALPVLNELAELNNCNNCVFFETRRHMDLYMWVAKTPNGPSVKFEVQNLHTMDEMSLMGNCLKGSRPVLAFDKAFDSEPQWQLLKELLTQVFAVPKTSRKIKPFVDHVMNFSLVDNRIWVRNYQIVHEADAAEVLATRKGKHFDPDSLDMEEIGPRFVLNPIRVFDRAFGGMTLYLNPNYVTPSAIRAVEKAKHGNRYQERV
ncbi:hypothetical protein CXG81DRAFT_5725, partial [Caulochytrium protostelioides]